MCVMKGPFLSQDSTNESSQEASRAEVRSVADGSALAVARGLPEVEEEEDREEELDNERARVGVPRGGSRWIRSAGTGSGGG